MTWTTTNIPAPIYLEWRKMDAVYIPKKERINFCEPLPYSARKEDDRSDKEMCLEIIAWGFNVKTGQYEGMVVFGTIDSLIFASEVVGNCEYQLNPYVGNEESYEYQFVGYRIRDNSRSRGEKDG